jgi:hypothetical protein
MSWIGMTTSSIQMILCQAFLVSLFVVAVSLCCTDGLKEKLHVDAISLHVRVCQLGS